ncbi:MAG: hypothetical protein Q9190_000777 [Brigantiaea leucoxantha]
MTTEIDGRLCGVGLDSKPLKYGGSVSGELEDAELIRYENMRKGIAPYKNIYHGYLAELNIKCESKNCLKLNSKGEKTSEDACEEMLAAVLEKFYRIEHKDLKDTKDLPLEPNIVFEVPEDLFEDYDQEWPDRLCDDIDMWGLGQEVHGIPRVMSGLEKWNTSEEEILAMRQQSVHHPSRWPACDDDDAHWQH